MKTLKNYELLSRTEKRTLLNAVAATIIRNAENSTVTMREDLIALFAALNIELPEFVTDMDFIDSCFDRNVGDALTVSYERIEKVFDDTYAAMIGEDDEETYYDRLERQYH